MSDVGVHRKGEVDFPTLLRRLREGSGEEVGAIGCFIGVVREVSREGEKLTLPANKFGGFLAQECVIYPKPNTLKAD